MLLRPCLTPETQLVFGPTEAVAGAARRRHGSDADRGMNTVSHRAHALTRARVRWRFVRAGVYFFVSLCVLFSVLVITLKRKCNTHLVSDINIKR